MNAEQTTPDTKRREGNFTFYPVPQQLEPASATSASHTYNAQS
jgi:CRISPR/Cas system endoribonuclease Cas6 (RAMP superfamily)